MVEVQSLDEIPTSIPDGKSRWRVVPGSRTLVDPAMVQVARVFDGELLADGSSQPSSTSTMTRLVEMYFSSGFSLTTIHTDELESELKKGHRHNGTQREGTDDSEPNQLAV